MDSNASGRCTCKATQPIAGAHFGLDLGCLLLIRIEGLSRLIFKRLGDS